MLDQITPIGLITFANFLTCALVCVVLLIRDRKSPINRSSAAFDFFIAVWSFFYFLSQSSSDRDLSILFFKICIIATVLINSGYIHFTFALIGRERVGRKFLWTVHALNLFFCYGAYTWFYDEWVIKFSYGLWPIPSKWFLIYLVWWFTQVFFCFFMLYFYGVKKYTGVKLSQIKWVLWPSLLAFIGGSTNWLVWLGVDFPPYLTLGVSFYALTIAFAIIKLRLFDYSSVMKMLQKERLAAVGLLATSINHDIKSPLYAVRAKLETLSDQLERNRNEMRPDALKSSIEQIDQVFEVIKKFNQFAVVGSSETEENMQASIPLALERVLKLFDNEIERKRIQLVEEDVGKLPNIRASQIHVDSILFNMLTNALQALEVGGRIKILGRLEGDHVCLTVQDNGCGMSESEQKNIFEPFSSSKKEEGAGLGMYVTRELVRQNRGKIQLKSIEGVGTSFELEFQVAA